MTTLVEIPFKSTTITAMSDEGKPLVSLRHMCESIGVNFASQFAKLKKKSWACVVLNTTHDATGRLQEMTMVDRRTMTMWLATIEASRVKPDARPMLEAFQNEAADALDAYFNEGIAVNPTATDHQISAGLRRAQMRMELLQSAKGLIHAGHLEVKARVVLAQGMGDTPEIPTEKAILYAKDYLAEKNLSRKQLNKVAGVFGKRVKAAYILKYGTEPERYPLNLSNGQTRPVNAYMESDRDLFDQVWANHYGALDETPNVLDLAS